MLVCWLIGGAVRCIIGVVFGNGRVNCIGFGIGGLGIGFEKGVGYDLGKVFDEECLFGIGLWFICIWVVCNEVFCIICGILGGKGEEECVFFVILFFIFIGVLIGGNCNCFWGEKLWGFGFEFVVCLFVVNWLDGNGCCWILGICIDIGCFFCCKLLLFWWKEGGKFWMLWYIMLCFWFFGNICGVCFCEELIEVRFDCGINVLEGRFVNFVGIEEFLLENDVGI